MLTARKRRQLILFGNGKLALINSGRHSEPHRAPCKLQAMNYWSSCGQPNNKHLAKTQTAGNQTPRLHFSSRAAKKHCGHPNDLQKQIKPRFHSHHPCRTKSSRGKNKSIRGSKLALRDDLNRRPKRSISVRLDRHSRGLAGPNTAERGNPFNPELTKSFCISFLKCCIRFA
jgi:hypothetical protein